jgi:hypothetical protein
MQSSYKNKRNKKAELALIFTITSLFLGVTAPIGFVLGILSLREVNRTGEKGKVIAWLSIAIPLLQLLVGILLYLRLSGAFGGGRLTF